MNDRAAKQGVIEIRYPFTGEVVGTKDLDDVDLDANVPPVSIVRRTVGASLEAADVAEGAAVRAAHVWVQ